MRRRRLLALAAAGVTGGCVGDGEDVPPDDIVTPAPVPTATPARERPTAFSVVSTAVQPGVAVSSADAVEIVDDAGQYLVVALTGDVPDRSAFEFRFGGRTYSPEPLARRLYRDWESDSYLVFPLPEAGDGGDAALRWPDGAWGPPASVVDRLEEPLPSFAVTLDGPETASEQSDPKLVVGVTNEGGSAGRYVLALNRWGPNTASAPVDRIAGELAAEASDGHIVDAVPPVESRPARYTLDVPREPGRLRHVISAPRAETE